MEIVDHIHTSQKILELQDDKLERVDHNHTLLKVLLCKNYLSFYEKNYLKTNFVAIGHFGDQENGMLTLLKPLKKSLSNTYPWDKWDYILFLHLFLMLIITFYLLC